jgi:GT2 family glycosyltransferase
VIFWDADDVMPAGFIIAHARNITAGPMNLGISYPISVRGTAAEAPFYITAERRPWDYWQQRESITICTPSAWRREALESVGGWPEANENADDYSLALRITALGWTARLLATPVVECSRHQLGHRSNAPIDTLERSLWNSRTLNIVTIHIGRDQNFDDWLTWLQTADLPPRTSLTIIDSAGNKWFARRLFQAVNALTWRFERITVLRHRHDALPADLERNDWRRSFEVAEDYNRAFAQATEDMILTVEDDTVPPPDAVRRLASHLRPHGKVAAAAGVYESARSPGYIAASLKPDRWISERYEGFPKEPFDAGWLPGGCTLFANWILRRALPLVVRCGPRTESVWNWDNDFSRKLRDLGYRLILDGRVRCEHNFNRARL